MIKHQRIMIIILLLITISWARVKLPSPCYLLELSSVGLPAADKTVDARRINDLTIFNEKLYIGCGDAVVNTGPTDIICYVFESDTFTTESTVDEEAIYRFQIIDNTLMIPGVDAKEDWSFGNIYVLADTGWIQHRTVPKGIHVNHLASFNGKLYAGTLTEGAVNGKAFYFGGVFCSADTGKTWTLSYATQSDDQRVFHIENLVVYKDKLFAFPHVHSGMTKQDIPEIYHDDLAKPFEENYYLVLIDDALGVCDVIVNNNDRWRYDDIIPRDKLCRISRPFVFKDLLIMPALFGKYVDYLTSNKQLPPQASTEIFTFNGDRTKSLKFDYDILVDVLVENDILYLLIKKKDLFYISKTNDLKKWEYFLIPPSVEHPRAIALHADTFFIGTNDGNIFKSIKHKPIKRFKEAENIVPMKIFGAAQSASDVKWYWVSITECSSDTCLAKFTAEVKHDNVIKVYTENITKMNLIPPLYYLKPDSDVSLIIDDSVVYDGILDMSKEIICKKTVDGNTVKWHVIQDEEDIKQE